MDEHQRDTSSVGGVTLLALDGSDESRSRLPAVSPAERYDALSELGRGGMGAVLEGHDPLVGRTVAIKTMRADLQDDPSARARFMREARVQGQLEHPSIVPVYEVGSDAHGTRYFSMRRIRGETLSEVLALSEDERPHLHKLLSVFVQVCMAVEYAHSRGVVHRDLKPDNIILGPFGEVYVLDWGIARVQGVEDVGPTSASEEDSVRTQQGAVLGTPGYMAPEQARDAGRASEASDVYSLGVILFEILTGKRLHEGPTPIALLASTLSDEDIRPTDRAPEVDIPPELDALCASAIRSTAEARLSSARAVADGVEAYLDGDRDLSLRKELAARHAEAATTAARTTLAADARRAEAARVRALEEAGRGIALDPTNEDAMRVAVEMILAPPERTPDEVATKLANEHAEALRLRAGKARQLVLAGGVLAVGTALWFGVRSWPAVAAMGGCMLVGVWLVHLATLARTPAERLSPLLDGALVPIFVAAGLAAGFLGPYINVPVFACMTVANALVIQNESRRWMTIALGPLAFLVPCVLEWTGVIPPIYSFDGASVTIRATMTNLPELPVRIGTMVANAFAIMSPALLLWPAVRAASAAHEKVMVQSWQLEKMLPRRRSSSGKSIP
jgi:serine/threonine-protein kinase